MPVEDRRRGAAMVRRAVFTARTTGVSGEGQALLEHACAAAVNVRAEALEDDHDPHYLHPARSALILLQDTGELNPVLLAAAALTETQRPDLRLADQMVREACPPALRAEVERALGLRAEIPDPRHPEALEALLAAGEAVRRVALAERLDHVRHAHMWHEGADLGAVLKEVDTVWEPLAGRTHELLAKRFRRWSRATRRRVERAGGG